MIYAAIMEDELVEARDAIGATRRPASASLPEIKITDVDANNDPNRQPRRGLLEHSGRQLRLRRGTRPQNVRRLNDGQVHGARSCKYTQGGEIADAPMRIWSRKEVEYYQATGFRKLDHYDQTVPNRAKKGRRIAEARNSAAAEITRRPRTPQAAEPEAAAARPRRTTANPPQRGQPTCR